MLIFLHKKGARKMNKVLIVEEDPMVADLLMGYLNKIGDMTVVGTATKEKDILRLIKEENIDLILLAVYLKEKNGLLVLKTLRQHGYHGEVIMVTAACTTDEVRKAYAYGVTDYVIKPFKFERFKEALMRFKQRSELFVTPRRLSQEDIDLISGSIKKSEELPKGLHSRTLDRIVTYIKAHKQEGWTLRGLAEEIGMSNVTVKKYMDYLEEQAIVEISLNNGQIGRPEHQYRLNVE